MLDLVHALAQRLGCVPGGRARAPGDHRPGVDALVDEMDGDAGLRAARASSIGVVPGRRAGATGGR